MRSILEILLLSVFFCLSNVSISQNLKGKVVNEQDKLPIPFANVYFINLNTGVSCNENGEFQYNGVLPSTLNIKVSAVGFTSNFMSINLPLNDDLIITLKSSHITLNEVTVNSTTGILQKYNITNIESKSITEITYNSPTNIGEAIANIPSVYNQSTGLGINKPVIRGFSGMRVVTLLNGLRIENQQWGNDHGMGLTENGIGNVEVIKGPSSILYGADALGGVIYFTDQKYAEHNSIETNLESRFESNTKGTTNFVTFKLNKNNFKLNLHGNYTNHADFTLPNNKYLKNSRFNERNVKASIGYHYHNWIVNLRYNFMNNIVGIPGHTHDTLIIPERFKSNKQNRDYTIPAQHINNHYALLENIFYFSKNELKIQIGYTSNNLKEYDEKLTVPGMDIFLNNSIYNVKLNHAFSEKSTLIIGAQGMYQKNINTPNATEILIPNGNVFDKGAYLLYHLEFNQWEIQSGLRYDSRTINTLNLYEGTNFNKNYQGLNYSIGAAKKINPILVRLNISSGYRPPHYTELLSNGVHHGTLRYEIGNKFLKSEFSNQLDLSAEYSNEHLFIGINPYIQYIQNYIYLDPANIRKNGYAQFNYKQSDFALLKGGDVSIHYHPHFLHQLHIENNISYIYAQDDKASALPLIPQPRFNTSIRFEFESKKTFHIENISIQHLYFLSQNRVAVYESPSSAYQLFHASASFKLNFKNPIYIRTGVKNIFNEAYIDHLSRLKNIGIESPGRNFYLSLKLNINYKLKNQKP